LSAPFVAQFFKVQLETVIPYADYIIGNESEAEAWGAAAGLPEPTNHISVARSIALLPKSNPSRPRVVVITRGADSTVVVSSAQPDEPKIHAVQKLTDSEIVDTNGAGDAFAGGFMGGLVLGKTLDEAIEVGHKMGAMNLKEVSVSLKHRSTCVHRVLRSGLNLHGQKYRLSEAHLSMPPQTQSHILEFDRSSSDPERRFHFNLEAKTIRVNPQDTWSLHK
jgi:pyridoxal/pyridoxine/pyridoxamine kinase